MRHMMIFATVFTLSFGLTQYVLGEEAKKEESKNEQMVCVTNETLDKMLPEKGYDILLNMTNEDGVVESIWTAGQSVIITAAVPNEKKSCLLAVMKDVTFNPKAIEEVWETYKKQTKQKDI